MSITMATTRQILEPKQGGDITYMDMVDEQSLGESEIQKLFVGATVLITGGTGSLGKLLIEKLLRSCHGIKKIYLLTRLKKNVNPTQRLEEQFNDIPYNNLKKQQPDFMAKIAIVEGDIGKFNLGISKEDRKMLTDEVEIIFHAAATIKFNEPLKTAVEINVRGTREILQLARECIRLKAMVHISTAYSNCVQSEIEEKFYDRKLSGDKLIHLIENVDEEIINKITPDLLGDYPNTYVYTKSAGEDIVRQYSKGLPVAVCRPSIVVGTATEPISGWTNNLNGLTRIVVGASVGILRVLRSNTKVIVDIIPGDMVVNCCIAIAWKVAKDYSRNVSNNEESPSPELPILIYNNVSGARNPLTTGQLTNYVKNFVKDSITIRTVWFPYLIMTTSRLWHTILRLLLHWLPAYILDTFAILLRKKPMLKKIYKKIDKFSDAITFFLMKEWKFHDDNCCKLYNEMCEADKQMFDIDITSLDWGEFSYNYVRRLRVHDTLPQARKRNKMLTVAHYFTSTIFAITILTLVWFIVKLLLQYVF